MFNTPGIASLNRRLGIENVQILDHLDSLVDTAVPEK